MSFRHPALHSHPASRASAARPHHAHRYGIAALAVAVAICAACGRKAAEPAARYSFVGFENLSGDSSLDWLSLGASEFLSRSLRSGLGGEVLSPDSIARTGQTLGVRAAGAPGISAAHAAAVLAGANRIVSGYIERTAAGIRVTAAEENALTHKTDRTLSATAASPFEALKLLARQFSAQPEPPLTANAEAFRLYCAALRGSTANAPPLLEQAVALDPDFGRAWISLARAAVALGDQTHTRNVIAQARAQKLAPIDRAWLAFEAASLEGNHAATLEAMRQVSVLEPGDIGLARALAAAESSDGNFSQAAAVWKNLSLKMPEDVEIRNQLGYTLAWSGDYSGALAALRAYEQLRPNEANPLDSQGDVNYWFAKYSNAATSYAAAYAKAPGFLNGADLYKGAWARFMAGDKPGADALFAKFRELREKSKDPIIGIFGADWLYRTGHPKEARALLTNALQKSDTPIPAAIRAAFAAQLALWDLLEGDRKTAANDLPPVGSVNFSPSDLIIRFAAAPTASAEEWEARAAHAITAPQLASVRSLALGYALILDGKNQAAIPVWEEIVKQSPATDFFPRNILARLKNQPADHLSPPDPANLNQFAAILDKLRSTK